MQKLGSPPTLFLIVGMLIAGYFQYFGASSLADPDSVSLWNIDQAEAAESSGAFTYIKDLYVLVSAIAWPYYAVSRGHGALVSYAITRYIPWLVIIVFVGLVGFFVNGNPAWILLAGARWLLLMHTAAGIMFILFVEQMNYFEQKLILLLSLALLAYNGYMVLTQVGAASAILGVGLGASRAVGVFSNAAVSGFFGLTCAFLASFLNSGRDFHLRTAVFLLSLFVILGSGTRFLMIIGFLLVSRNIYRFASRIMDQSTISKVGLFVVPALLAASIAIYNTMISAVGRGGIIEEAMHSDGRFGLLASRLNAIYSDGAVGLLFGGGLGVGTNTAISLAINNGSDPSAIPLNLLADNALVTIGLQLGLVGTLFFWGGIFLVIRSLKALGNYSKLDFIGLVIALLITLFAGSPFDHFFLMTGFAVAFGAASKVAQSH